MKKNYMEDNNSNKRKQKIDISVVLSFVVAIFAIVSLLACGISEVSYAADTASYPDPDFNMYKKYCSDGQYLKVVGYNSKDTTENLEVPLSYSSKSYNWSDLLLGLEHNKDTYFDSEYFYDSEITDDAVLYILSKSPSEGVNYLGLNYNGIEYVNAWVVQTALWVYLNEKDPDNPQFTDDELSVIKNIDQISVPGDSSYTTDLTFSEGLYKYVSQLITDAKKANYNKPITVSKENDNITLVSDANVYQTSVITVDGGGLLSYDIKLSGIDGVYAVDENGNKLETTNVALGTKFYVRIPKDKVIEKTQTLNISVTGHFEVLSGNAYYTPSLKPFKYYQKIAKLSKTTKDENSGVSIEIIGTPNTGMTTAQTIYFIGLIVLLCGVGIIYVNIKLVESKQ
jgi:hypothetical protein